MLRSGSFLKAYEVGKESYAADAMYPAAQLGATELQVEFRRDSTGGRDVIKKVYNTKLYQ